MKELSIEEKAKRYDNVLERAKDFQKVNGAAGSAVISEIFPEFAKNEDKDEKIRTNCIHFLELQKSHHAATFEIEECIDWLEKQGEKPQGKSIIKAWKDMRCEVYAQASGNRHEPNCSDNNTEIFSLNDIDEIIEKIATGNVG